MSSSEKEHVALALLSRAHTPATASQIHHEKIQNRPLLLRPSSHDPRDNARTQRQKARLDRAAAARKSKKPRPLTAKQKRSLRVYEIPKEQCKYEIYLPIWNLWCGYMRDVLGMERNPAVNPAVAGPFLASAEYHGAMVEVVRSRCVGRVGIKGIVVKDTKFTFEIITPNNQLKTVPKEYTVFRFEVPFAHQDTDGDSDMKEQPRPLVFEIHGSQFENRPADRANRKFKQHIDPDL